MAPRNPFLIVGPRSPTPGAPHIYVKTPHFPSAFGSQTLRDLPNIEALEDAAMLHKDYLAAEEIPIAISYDDDAQPLDGDID